MNNFQFPDNLNLITSNMKVEQLTLFKNSMRHFKKLLDEEKIEEIYSNIIIPMFQVLSILYEKSHINTEQFGKRISSLMNLLQSIEAIIKFNNHYIFTAIIVIEDKQSSLFYSKIVSGLLHSNNIYPIIVIGPVDGKTNEQLIEKYHTSKLTHANCPIDGKLERSSSVVRFRKISDPELAHLINSRSKNLFNISRWLFQDNVVFPEKFQ